MSKVDPNEVAFHIKTHNRIEVVECENGFFAEIPSLPGCMTEARTWNEIYDNIKDARIAWITTAIEDRIRIPTPQCPSEEDRDSRATFVVMPGSAAQEDYAGSIMGEGLARAA